MLRIPVAHKREAERAIWIDIDLGALRDNVRRYRELLGDRCELIAIVKANAYGHGAVAIARALRTFGVETLAVGSVREGCELRTAGVDGAILVVGPCLPEEADAAITARLTPTLTTVAQVREFAAAADGVLDCHVEIDTGLRRHGVAAPAFADFVRTLRSRGRLRLAGVFTHFAGLGARDLPDMRSQLAEFEAALARVRDLGTPRRHTCNTLVTGLLPEAHLDAVRIGGGLYGLRGGGHPVLSLHARCVGLRDAACGDRVGYGGSFVCARPSRLALLPLGYADGLTPALWRDTEVLVRGARAPIVGRISMNQLVVDVTDVPGVALGEVFTFIGRDGAEQIRARERAPAEGSVYEVTTVLGPGLPRHVAG